MSDATFYSDGLARILDEGLTVPSVRGSLSTASHFGAGDRPWRELIGHSFSFANTRPFLFYSPAQPLHLPYCFGLLAWTLAGREDVGALAYYRPSAKDYSDDGLTLCGAFGARLFGLGRRDDQIAGIVERLREDPASRRTFATIARASDNLSESREYPCAAGVQFFLRDGALHMMTVMRAQQALTVLPYDVFLFSTLHHFVADAVGVPAGRYHHHSGTFHIYENEIAQARRVREDKVVTIDLPQLESGAGEATWRELADLEQRLRDAAVAGDRTEVKRLSEIPLKYQFTETARPHLVAFAETTAEKHGLPSRSVR